MNPRVFLSPRRHRGSRANCSPSSLENRWLCWPLPGDPELYGMGTTGKPSGRGQQTAAALLRRRGYLLDLDAEILQDVFADDGLSAGGGELSDDTYF